MKFELKIELKNQEELKNIIEKLYFNDGNTGKLSGKKFNILILKNDPVSIALKGLNDLTVKILNDSLIEGSMRCLVQENDDDIFLYPVNNYCIIDENKKYSFY